MENVNIKHNGYQYADQTQVTPKGVCNTCRQNSQEKIWYFQNGTKPSHCPTYWQTDIPVIVYSGTKFRLFQAHNTVWKINIHKEVLIRQNFSVVCHA